MERGMVKSATRVFDLLELFEKERRPLRAVEIVAMLRLPQSSVSMLLQTLVARGYMEFDAETREYCPSVRVSFLNEWATRRQGPGNTIRDAMRRLSGETGETVLLDVPLTGAALQSFINRTWPTFQAMTRSIGLTVE